MVVDFIQLVAHTLAHDPAHLQRQRSVRMSKSNGKDRTLALRDELVARGIEPSRALELARREVAKVRAKTQPVQQKPPTAN